MKVKNHRQLRKGKINRVELLSFLMLTGMLEPAYFTRLRYVHMIFQALTLGAYAIIFLRLVEVRKSYKPSRYWLIFTGMMVQLVFVTVLQQKRIGDVFQYTLAMTAVLFYVDTLSPGGIFHAMKGFRLYLALLVYINFLTVLLFPNGLYEGAKAAHENYYFLGHNNMVVRYLLPAIIMSCLVDYVADGRLTLFSYLLAFTSMITVTLTWSNAAMVGIGVVCLWMVFSGALNRKIISRLTGKLLFWIPIVLFLLFVVLQKAELFSFIIVNLFQKNTNLSGRIFIWNATLQAIEDNFLLGYGYGLSISALGYYSIDAASSHNFFLDLLLRGGVVHFAIHILLNWISCRKLSRGRSNIQCAIVVGVLIYFVLWQFSVFTGSESVLMYVLFLLAYKIRRIEAFTMRAPAKAEQGESVHAE